jgi:hypothetical protein
MMFIYINRNVIDTNLITTMLQHIQLFLYTSIFIYFLKNDIMTLLFIHQNIQKVTFDRNFC